MNYFLLKFEQYDREYQVDMVKMFEYFIDVDSNVNIVVKVFNIYVNILNYRLKRISQIVEIDLKNVNEKFMIYFDIKFCSMDL